LLQKIQSDISFGLVFLSLASAHQALITQFLVEAFNRGMLGPHKSVIIFEIFERSEVMQVKEHFLDFSREVSVGRIESYKKILIFLLLFSEGMPLLVELFNFPEMFNTEVVRVDVFSVVVDIHDFQMVLMNELQYFFYSVLAVLLIVVIFKRALSFHPLKDPVGFKRHIFLFE